jgi:acyl-CoA synthetase (AMP-forming)/AMP-acid ligase II
MMRNRPDTMLVLLAAFALGVIVTLLMPMSSSETVAAPASPLQAGLPPDR